MTDNIPDEFSDKLFNDVQQMRIKSKGRYNLFVPYLEHIDKYFKNHRILKNGVDVKKEFIRGMIDYQCCIHDERIDYEKIVTEPGVMEFVYTKILKEKNNPTLFIPSKSFTKELYSCSFSITHEALKLPFGGSFYIAFRNKLIIEGVKIRGCIFSCNKFHGEIVKNITDIVEDVYNITVGHYTPKHEDFDVYSMLMVTDGGVTISREFTPDILLEVLHHKDTSVIDVELKVHLRLCLAICCYIQAIPQSIVSGVPNDYKGEVSQYTRIINVTSNPRNKTSKSMHFRRGHFMVLRSDRYKHNEDGTPKIVFRKATVINADIDPYTLKKKEK